MGQMGWGKKKPAYILD